MKKITLTIIFLLFVCIFSGCEDTLSSAEKGEKAAVEACDCLKKKSKSKCEDELNSKYSLYTNNDDFIKAFNKAQNCDIYIYKKK